MVVEALYVSGVGYEIAKWSGVGSRCAVEWTGDQNHSMCSGADDACYNPYVKDVHTNTQ